jgi:hypothetical protein
MQITIEIPDDLAQQLEPEREHLVEVLRRGLSQSRSLPIAAGNCALAEEILVFLARGPHPKEIVAFRPSQKSVDRIRELLEKNRQRTLTTEEEVEMDYIESVNNLYALIKAHARQVLQAA